MKQLASLIGFGLWGVEPPAALLPASEESFGKDVSAFEMLLSLHDTAAKATIDRQTAAVISFFTFIKAPPFFDILSYILTKVNEPAQVAFAASLHILFHLF